MTTALWHALFTGTAVALACGPVGYLLVLRAQIFAADALSHVAFTGALAALAFGLDARVGLFVVTVAVGFGMTALEKRGRPDDVLTGGVFAWVLGIGVLFLSIYSRGGNGDDGAAGVRVLFGSILGLNRGQTVVAVLIGLAVAITVVFLSRPLIFASLDPIVAATRGVPVRGLGFAFMVLLAVTAAEASQVVGSLLILGLLSAPAGAAVRLTDRPLRGMAIATSISIGSVWLGLVVSHQIPKAPASFCIICVATLAFVVASIASEEASDTVRA